MVAGPPRTALEIDPYAVIVERLDNGETEVTCNGLEYEDILAIGERNHSNGYGIVLTGRVDPNRPGMPPHKTPWLCGYHGFSGRYGSPDELLEMCSRVMRRMVKRGERGITNLGNRLPPCEIGLDVDAYDGKRGLITLAEHEARLGKLPPTIRVTAREFESGSGIKLFRVPQDWHGAGMLRTPDGGYGDVDLIQPHLRFIMPPGALHHTGNLYCAFDERTESEIAPQILPPPTELPELTPPWLEFLYRKPRQRGTRPESGSPMDLEDITAAALEWVFDECPGALAKTLRDVRCANGNGQTRNAFHRALYIAAKKSRAGCYPFSRAVVEIRAAAESAYKARDLTLDLDEFARSISHAVAEAIDLSDDELLSWGGWRNTNAKGTPS